MKQVRQPSFEAKMPVMNKIEFFEIVELLHQLVDLFLHHGPAYLTALILGIARSHPPISLVRAHLG